MKLEVKFISLSSLSEFVLLNGPFNYASICVATKREREDKGEERERERERKKNIDRERERKKG
jgi:hypothetical protein